MKEIFDIILIKEVIYPIVIILIGFIVYFLLSKSVKKVFKLRISKMDVRRSKTLCGLINFIISFLSLSNYNIYDIILIDWSSYYEEKNFKIFTIYRSY